MALYTLRPAPETESREDAEVEVMINAVSLRNFLMNAAHDGWVVVLG